MGPLNGAVAVVGLGVIGASVGLAARRAWPDRSLVGVDRGRALRHPAVVDTFDGAGDDLAFLESAEIVVLATPVDAILALLPPIAQWLAPGALVLDAGSTKRRIVAAAAAAGLTRFVGGHPMAGAAGRGADHARADLFDGKAWFLVPGAADPGALADASAFVSALGARPHVFQDDGTEHDRIMAAVSHLPQVVASALMKVAGESAGEDLRWAGAGLRDTTRLAASPASTWASILATNADALGPLLVAMADELRGLSVRLEDGEAVRRVFDAANRFKIRHEGHEEI